MTLQIGVYVATFQCRWCFHPEGGSQLLWNVSNWLPVDTSEDFNFEYTLWHTVPL